MSGNEGLGSWVRRRAMKSGQKSAIIFEGAELSYLRLDKRVTMLANALRDRGVLAGSRVAYLGDNEPAFFEVLFAVATLGAIFVPLNTRLAAPEIRYELEDSRSGLLIHAERLQELARTAVEATSVTRLIEVGETRDRSHDTPVSADVPTESFEEVLAGGSSDHFEAEVSLEDPALILYTSGTTGYPRGALLTHGNLTWNAMNVIVDYDLVSSDVALMISPLFHVASLGMGALPTLLKGATMILEPRFDPGIALQQIERYRVTWLSGVPTTFQLICEHPAWQTTDLSSLEKLTCGGSPVPLRVLDAYEQRGLSFTGGYGMTESSPGATSLQPGRSRDKAGSSGLPHFFTELRVVDSSYTEVEVGTVGEILLRGPNVMARYWNHPDAEEYGTDGWFRSGDLGYLDEDGFLFVTDRLKDMIVSGGENVYPAEIEQIILELDGVSGVAVIGMPDEKWGEVPIAILTIRDGFDVDEVLVRNVLKDRIAKYKVPKRIVFVDDLPRTASGKVRKLELRRQYAGEKSKEH
jgi:fatty-acyl-CoA synthase